MLSCILLWLLYKLLHRFSHNWNIISLSRITPVELWKECFNFYKRFACGSGTGSGSENVNPVTDTIPNRPYVVSVDVTPQQSVSKLTLVTVCNETVFLIPESAYGTWWFWSPMHSSWLSCCWDWGTTWASFGQAAAPSSQPSMDWYDSSCARHFLNWCDI